MRREYRFSQFLAKDKSNMSMDSFSNAFYRNIAFYNLSCDKDAYKDLLSELYAKKSDDYDTWRKAFNKINYSFIRGNKELVTTLIRENRLELINKAYEMEKLKNGLISRSVPIRATTGSIKYSKEDLYELLYDTLVLLDSETLDNPIKKSQDTFYSSYSEYEKDEYLGEFYNDIMTSFEGSIRSAIEEEINKIDGLSKYMVDNMCITMMKDDLEHNEKCYRTPKVFKQKRKYS